MSRAAGSNILKRHCLATSTSVAAIASLAACGALQPPSATPQTRAIATHAGRGGSWMLPEAEADKLLYISDASNGTVAVYTYPKVQLVGTLTGFGLPWGVCSGKTGDIFVTDYRNEQIVEYRHGGSSPIKTLSSGGYFPVACALNPVTGDLAVANISSEGSVGYPPGVISVYAAAQGEPKNYNTAQDLNFFGCAYDDKGNLFAVGSGYSGPDYQMVELPKHKTNLVEIQLKPALPNSVYPGGLQWDGKYVALGIANNLIYQYTVSKSVAKQNGVTELSGKGVAIGLFWVGTFGKGSDHQATQLIAVTNYNNANKAQVYSYPNGGMPTGTISNGLDGPLDATVSFAPSR